uniref:Uncharacterized protein n=1 Tax=Ditylenchus dipsaci TaxID=166011 RepID=A0A915DRW5_9BILA
MNEAMRGMEEPVIAAINSTALEKTLEFRKSYTAILGARPVLPILKFRTNGRVTTMVIHSSSMIREEIAQADLSSYLFSSCLRQFICCSVERVITLLGFRNWSM